MSCYTFYVGANDNSIRLEGLKDPEDGAFINDATVSVTLYDEEGVELAGATWPLVLDYVAASDGDYVGVLEDGVTAEDGQEGVLIVTAVSGALNGEWEARYVFKTRSAVEYLTSQRELEDMFGVENVERWADLENEGDAATIRRRVQWAVDEATAEALQLLVGSPAHGACHTDRMLRIATTRLAGVMLYESRGVKDTADEEGRHRLKWHRDRARLYFQQVQAGQVRVGSLGGTPKGVPASIVDE